MHVLRYCVASLLLLAAMVAGPGHAATVDTRLPEFTRSDTAGWINSPPLNIASLRGSVVLVDVWAFECWNCYRSFPWLHALEARLAGENFKVIGIHSPELASERDPVAVAAKVREFGLHNPIMLDTDHRYWDALGNQYWPAWYLVDQQGRIRARYVGETHDGDDQARRIEANIRALLAQAAKP